MNIKEQTNKDKAMLRWIESPEGTKAVTNALNIVKDIVVNAVESNSKEII